MIVGRGNVDFSVLSNGRTSTHFVLKCKNCEGKRVHDAVSQNKAQHGGVSWCVVGVACPQAWKDATDGDGTSEMLKPAGSTSQAGIAVHYRYSGSSSTGIVPMKRPFCQGFVASMLLHPCTFCEVSGFDDVRHMSKYTSSSF